MIDKKIKRNYKYKVYLIRKSKEIRNIKYIS